MMRWCTHSLRQYPRHDLPIGLSAEHSSRAGAMQARRAITMIRRHKWAECFVRDHVNSESVAVIRLPALGAEKTLRWNSEVSNGSVRVPHGHILVIYVKCAEFKRISLSLDPTKIMQSCFDGRRYKQ